MNVEVLTDNSLAKIAARSRQSVLRIGHDAGGFRHMPSVRTNAQTFGIELVAQMFGLVWRQPSVWVAVSFGFNGAWKIPCCFWFGIIGSRYFQGLAGAGAWLSKGGI